MLRRILIASAAAAMLLVTFIPTTHLPAAVAACALEVSTAAEPCEGEATAEARSQFGDTGAALSLCAAGATAIAATAIAVTVSARRQWARLRSVRQRRGPTIAVAAATTPTATTFALAGTVRTDGAARWPWCEADDEVIGIVFCVNCAANRKCSARKMRMVNRRCEPRGRPAAAPAAAPALSTTQQPAATPR